MSDTENRAQVLLFDLMLGYKDLSEALALEIESIVATLGPKSADGPEWALWAHAMEKIEDRAAILREKEDDFKELLGRLADEFEGQEEMEAAEDSVPEMR
jgi:hypothetical protein